MSKLFRIFTKQNDQLENIYDEETLSGTVFWELLDYLDANGIMFEMPEDIDPEEVAFAVEVTPEEAQEALDFLESEQGAVEELLLESDFSVQQLATAKSILVKQFEKLCTTQDDTTMVLEIY